jgi:hypothetical protein
VVRGALAKSYRLGPLFLNLGLAANGHGSRAPSAVVPFAVGVNDPSVRLRPHPSGAAGHEDRP